MDLSKIPTSDLEALQSGDLGRVSTPTLEYLNGGGNVPYQEQPKVQAPSLTTGQQIARTALPVVKPVLQYGGAAIGGILGATGGALSPTAPVTSPAGGILGAGLGYAGGTATANKIEEYAGLRKPESPLQQVSTTGKNIVEGAGMEMGGQIIGKSLSLMGKQLQGTSEWFASHSIKTPTGSRWQKVLPETEYSAREAVVNKMINEKIPPNKYGRAYVDNRISQIQNRISDEITAIAKEKSVGSYDLINPLKQVKGDAYFSSSPEKALEAISGVEKSVIKKGIMNPQELQMLKQQFYQDVNWDRKNPVVDSAGRFTEKARKAIAHNAMVTLEGWVPELKTLNKNEAVYLDLKKAIENTIHRYENTNAVGLGAKILTLRNIGLAASELLLGTPAIKAKIAFVLSKVGTKPSLLAKVTPFAVGASANALNNEVIN
jgi:hypothetical protein